MPFQLTMPSRTSRLCAGKDTAEARQELYDRARAVLGIFSLLML
jgi:hypothetical protein